MLLLSCIKDQEEEDPPAVWSTKSNVCVSVLSVLQHDIYVLKL